MRGFKISLEGIDGAGKTTQLSHATEYMTDHGFDVLVKPCRNNIDSSGIDSDLLKIVKYSDSIRRDAATSALLSAARTSYMDENVLNPHLANGGVIIADRDIDTAVAYSLPDLVDKYPQRKPEEHIDWLLGLYSVNHAIPDLTIYLDVEPKRALQRALDDEVPNERVIVTDENLQYIALVQQGYQRIIERNQGRIRVINVNERAVAEVSEAVTAHLDTFLDGRV